MTMAMSSGPEMAHTTPVVLSDTKHCIGENGSTPDRQICGGPMRLPVGDRLFVAVAARCRNIRGFHFVLHAHGYVEWTSDGAYHTGCIVGYEALHWGARDIPR